MAKNVLYVATGIVHPTIGIIRKVRKMLESVEGLAVTRSTSVEGLIKLESDEFDAVVLMFHRKKISSRALNALRNFVEGGGGCLAIHAAAASFKEVPEYEELVGGKFVSHDAVHEFTVNPDPNSNVFGDIQPFTVRDELYVHRYSDDIHVHAVASNDGGNEPVIWTREWGKGRVCYFSLGHTGKSVAHPAFREVVTRGISRVLED